MSARLPLLHKTPLVLDERPLDEATSPRAGLLSVSRVYRALGLPALVGVNLALRKRQSIGEDLGSCRPQSGRQMRAVKAMALGRDALVIRK